MAGWATVKLNGNGATTAGTSVIYAYNDGSSILRWNTSQSLLYQEILSIPKLPKRTCHSLNGFYSASSGGTKKVDSSGSLASIQPSAVTAQTVTWYAQWTRVSWDFNFNAEGSSIPKQTVYLKVRAGGTYSDDQCKNPVTSVTVPTRAGFRFLGYFGTSASHVKYVEPDGSFTSALLRKVPTKSSNVYAEWEEHHSLTFDPNGGTVSSSSKEVVVGSPIGELPTPTRDHYHFDGWFTEAVGGELVTSDTVYDWSADITVYAHWTRKPILTFDPNGGTVSETTRECWYGDALGALPRPSKVEFFFDGWFTDVESGELVTAGTTYDWQGDATVYAHWTEDEQYRLLFDANGGSASESERIVRPGVAVGELPTATRGKHTFGGWWTARTGGTQWTSETVVDLHEDTTLFAHWTRTEFTLSFDARGGTASFATKEVLLNTAVGELPTCEKYANTFLGWFASATGGAQWTSDTVFDLSADKTLYAQWYVDPSYQRTLVLDANGGTVSTTSVVCTYGLAIGIIPKPERSGKIFKGWYTAKSGGTRLNEATVCSWSGSKTIYARWADDAFGSLTDWFDLDSETGPLMLVGSNSGATRTVIETSHTGALAIQNGDSSVGAFNASGILMNPVCTYRIRKKGRVTVSLGAAWSGSGTSKSGYMLVSAEYATASDGEPVLVVRGIANEGANAINRWSVSLDVDPDHIAQDPMGAIRGGGEITECKTLITCDPVVPYENGMPCASDIVHGKVVVTATTNAYAGESAPTAAGSFVESNSVPTEETDVDFTTFSITAERSL